MNIKPVIKEVKEFKFSKSDIEIIILEYLKIENRSSYEKIVFDWDGIPIGLFLTAEKIKEQAK